MLVIKKVQFQNDKIPSVDVFSCWCPFRVFKIEVGNRTGENCLSIKDENESTVRVSSA